MSHARRWTSVLALSALTTLPSLAAQENPFELSLVAVPGSSEAQYLGDDFELGYGVGLGWGFAEDWAVELRGLRRENDSPFVDITLDSYELGLRRYFGAALRPFVQLGALHQSAEIGQEIRCAVGVRAPCPQVVERNENGGFVGGGVDWNFSSRAALRFDGRALYYESDATGETENRLDLTAGLVFRL